MGATNRATTADSADQPIRVLVVDDHPIVTAGVRLLLDPHPDLEVVATACTGAEAVRWVSTAVAPIDVVLLDLRMPDTDPAELVRALRTRRPEPKIIVFTAHPQHTLLQPVLEAGIDGCLVKDSATADLPAALREVVAGRRVFDPRLGTRPDLTLRDRLAEYHLTRREYEVIRLVATGRTNPEIAVEMSVTRNTVKTYLQSAMHKLGARNRVEVITRAGEASLL
ncbi:response regulator [Millisia brevis]|uniref:response regulator n=1 Tax=Millisia brevis TaxID=264148 RepID=UPI001FDF35C2|nr:response regulator transcription factor [Millisia brevis]